MVILFGSESWVMSEAMTRTVKRNSYNILKSDHGEEGMDKHRRVMVDTGGRRGVEDGWNAYSRHIHRLQEGDSGTVGGYKTDI